MAHWKLTAKLIADLLGISTVFLAWVTNLDNVKSTIIFIVSLVYVLVRLYFYIRKQMQDIKRSEQEAAMRDLDLVEKRLKAKDKELKRLEEELSLRITGLTTEERHNRDKKH